MSRSDTDQQQEIDSMNANSNAKMPSVINMNDFKPSYLTQDIAAQKIRHAFSQYLIKKWQTSLLRKINCTSSKKPHKNNLTTIALGKESPKKF